MSLRIANRISSEVVTIEIPEIPNYSFVGNAVSSKNKVFELVKDESGKTNRFNLPADDYEYRIYLWAEPLVVGMPPPSAELRISQGEELLELVLNANPSSVSALPAEKSNPAHNDGRHRMNFLLLWLK